MNEDWFTDQKKIVGMVNHKRALVFVAFLHKGRLTATVKSFTGLANIGFFKTKERQKYHLTAVTESGRMKLVAVNRQKEITVLTETGNETGKIVYLNPGRYRIRAIGIQCSFHLVMSVDGPDQKQ
jgi:hypothetical protein